ncbi:LacI family DNA-binding transcriptional regulator [Kineosporia succinea]|uniref:LacI family transcriptional regulator n=1 Tax=Kineosporia succinea TaxID=84632 RepID=A0ABT9P1Z5_9ACTN|nr:LacI family DNA-binding transcriptional regulator [Kineosporia succinea]MDP9826668.1 LacI family transcriptional regulator [Kineosporia succinea]
MDSQLPETAGPLNRGAHLGRRPTMRDVAALAGVSLKTVSRVVNGEPGVSSTLGRRVRDAIDELDFRPNIGARSLRRAGGRTATVGLLLEDVSNPFSSALQRAVEDVAIPRGVMVFTASLDEDPQRERELTRAFSARRADGLIIAPASNDQSYLESELRAGTAIVCIDREARHLEVDSVLTTNVAGASAGVKHLIDHGHRRIAFLGDRADITTAQQRYEGYTQALTTAGLPVDTGIVLSDLTSQALAQAAAAELLRGDDPPTAVFAAQNLVTIGVARALRQLGRERGVALVGFDDFPLADLLDPGVTVVAQDPTAIGRLAATVLFDRIGGSDSPPATHVVPTKLITRGSGEIRPGSNLR